MVSIVVVATILIAMMWGVIVVSIAGARAGAMERTRGEAQNLAAAFMNEVTLALHHVDGVLNLIAERMRREGGGFDLHDWVSENPGVNEGAAQMAIIGPDGMMLSTSMGAQAAPIDLSDREHFRIHLDGGHKGLFISKPVIGRASGKWSIQISRRVATDDGRFLGVAVFSLLPSSLTNLHHSVDFGARGVLVLTGTDNIIRGRFTRAKPDGTDGMGTSVAGSPRPSEIPENGKGFYQRVSVVDGVPRLYAYNRVAQYPLVVTVGLDLDQGLQGANNPARVLVALATLATLLVGTLVPYLVREISQRTKREIELRQSKEAADLVTRKLHEAQSALVTTARQAGMAEIANNVLHNVGNVLNSVNVSACLVNSKMRDSKAQGLAKAVQLMNEHAADLGDFLTRDAKGTLLLGYLNKLVAVLAAEQRSIVEELGSLTKSVDHIKDIVATQQSYAGAASVVEAVHIRDLLEEALRMNAGALTRHEVTVVKDFADVPLLWLDKPRVLQILVNLISNATQAMHSVLDRSHHITLRMGVAEHAEGRRLRICVEDNGEGIAPEYLARLFAHGFTTRKQGHGFGLHSCALAATEMGGTLTAHSHGPGQGAAFTLALPLKPVGELP